MWRHSLGLGWGRASRVLSRGVLALPRMHFGVLSFGHTLSERRGIISMPHGFAYCESSSERWVGSPAGQYFLPRPSSVVTWDCASTLTPPRLSRAPPLYCDSPPWPIPAFPHRDVQHVYFVDSFIARVPQNNAQTTSLALPRMVTPSAAI